MSLSARRESLLKSSISIKSMRDSVAKFNKGLNAAKKSAIEIVKNTKESNLFKRTLISKDNNFFRKRQENIRRKAREDEIEAVSLSGAVKQQGSILAKSTRGFLGRLLDFVGILLIGWAVVNLPKIIAALSGLIKLIQKVTKILGIFINSIKNIVAGIGSVISEALSKIPFFDYEKNKKGITENIEKTSGGLARLDQQLVQTGNEFTDFGDEMDVILENEPSQNQQGNQNTSNNNQQPGNIEEIKEQSEKIGFGVDEFIKNNKDEGEGESQDEQEDLTKDIKAPPPTSNEVALSKIEDPKVKAKEILENKLKETNIDTKKVSEDALSESTKGKIESNEPRRMIMSPLLAKRYRERTGADRPLTVNGVTYKPGDKGYNEAFNMVGDAMKSTGALIPISKSETNMEAMKKNRVSVKSKKRKNEKTIFIVEKKSEMPTTTMMASNGGSKSFNVQEQVNKEKILMNLQSASSLKYT